MDGRRVDSLRQGTIVTVAPVGHPLSLAQAKRQLRIEPDDTSQDDVTNDLIAAAHRAVENMLGYPILQQTRQTHLRGFPCGPIWLGGGAGLTVSQVRYIDSAGATQVLAGTEWLVDAVSRPAAIHVPPGKVWPVAPIRPGAVMIDWLAGWTSAALVPDDLIHAMRLLVGHWDQNREAVVVGTISSAVQLTVDDLLYPHRVPLIV